MPFEFKTDRLCGAATLVAPKRRAFALCGSRSRNSQRGQGEFRRKQTLRATGLVLRWWLGVVCVLVLSTLWGGDTVLEKGMRSIVFVSLEIMEVGGPSLLSNGWHESFPAKCPEHGGKRGPCGLGFCKGYPCGENTDWGEVWESTLLQRAPSRREFAVSRWTRGRNVYGSCRKRFLRYDCVC
jgi:hypothetical protein